MSRVHLSCRLVQALAAMSLLALAVSAARSQVAYSLAPVADASIFSDGGLPTSTWDDVADGAGPSLWTSVTAGGVLRRSLLRFDLTAIPADHQVLSVTLSLYESRARDTHALSLHRLLASWDQGPANGGASGTGASASAGDVTWRWRSYQSLAWDARGGDFASQASATTTVGAGGQGYSWTGNGALLSDVQSWVSNPGSNFGWILIGDEAGNQNAKRFDSLESGVASQRPMLMVLAAPVPEPAHWALWLTGLAGLAIRSAARQRTGGARQAA